MHIPDDKPYDSIATSPMLDLSYALLLVFLFMCAVLVIKTAQFCGGGAE